MEDSNICIFSKWLIIIQNDYNASLGQSVQHNRIVNLPFQLLHETLYFRPNGAPCISKGASLMSFLAMFPQTVVRLKSHFIKSELCAKVCQIPFQKVHKNLFNKWIGLNMCRDEFGIETRYSSKECPQYMVIKNL